MDFKKLIRIAFLILLIFFFFKLGAAMFGASEAEVAKDAKLIANRPWIQRLPKNDREVVPGLVLAKVKPGTPRFGAVGAGSLYRFQFDVVEWALHGTELTVRIPQERTTIKLRARTWGCKDAPGPLDLCLELSDGEHELLLYSKKGWKIIEPKAEAEATSAVDRWAQVNGTRLQALLENPADPCSDCEEREEGLELLFSEDETN